MQGLSKYDLRQDWRAGPGRQRGSGVWKGLSALYLNAKQLKIFKLIFFGVLLFLKKVVRIRFTFWHDPTGYTI